MNAAVLRSSFRAWWSPSFRQRREAGPLWLQYVWTFCFNSATAVALTLLTALFSQRSVPSTLPANFVIAQCIGFTIHLLFAAGIRLIGLDAIERANALQRVLFYCGIPIVGVLVGYGLGLTLLGVDVKKVVADSPRIPGQIVFFSLVLSAFWYRAMAAKARLARAEAERERERARALATDRQLLDAQLRALQAQIEPHFLFNTLAGVLSLIDTAPDQARVMLARLIELLRASLAASRTPRAEAGREIDLVRAYLDILAIRMGARLRYTIDAPDAVRRCALPPLLVQPLVENAIKHGLEPKLEGGAVAVTLREDGDTLRVQVEDDGLGFAPSPSSGVGLDNLRERLAALYGDRARLTIESLAPGTRVVVTLPRETVAA